MKRFFALMAVILAVVSCQKDVDNLDVNMGGGQLVDITISLPETTRASSGVGALENGVLANYDLRYILEIYRVEGTEIQYDDCQRFVKPTDETTVVFPVRLVAGEGRNYKIVAWADIVETGSEDDRYYYTKDGLDNVVLMDNGTVNWNAMDETRDAYTAEKLINNFNSASVLNLTLTRPFAKVRVIATDIDDVINVGIEPTTAEANYLEHMPHKFNAAADNGVAFNEKPALDHSYTYGETATEYTDNDGEMTLFADYVFVPQSGTAKFSLDVFDAQGRSIKNNAFNTEIYVERNKVTTIKGDVLTTGGNVIVKVEDEFDGETEIKVVDTPEALQEVINNIKDGGSANIELGGNIDLGAIAGILSTRSAATLPLQIPEGKTLVLDLNGFTITTPWEDESAQKHYYAFENHGTLTIKDSSENGNGKIVARGNFNYGTMTLESGTIDACDGNGGYGVRNYDDAEFVMNGGAVIARNEDGDDRVSGNYDATPIRVDEGATATINNGTITNICNYTSAIENHGTTTINGGSFTSVHSTVTNYGTMTIKGSETTIKCDGEYTSAHPIYAYGEASVTTIENGNIIGNDKASCYYVAVADNSTVYISGGTFTNARQAAFTGEGTIVVTGGQFDKDPSSCVDSDYTVEQNDNNYVVVRKPDVAKIGEVGYTTLAKAVAAVEDGGTITLVANEVFTETNRYNNGGWWDGLGYSGDKSFTIDLNSKTICQDGALNDYLIWIKNDGSKANTITLKNGTLDAGTTAYCAFATASSNKQKITINFENVNLVGNNSNGAVAKIRGGAELNVKAGTVITGKNNYVGIEAVGNNTVVNIYDNVNIYQNGTGSYVGGIVGASYNATMNIYGGYGKSAKCGIIVMSTGATINVSGGEWIANNDGTVAAGNNGVLVSQNNRNEKGWACKSILNVTGGTFKGGYDCWGMGPGVEPDDAQINIKGGNFNSDPSSYLAEGCVAKEANGVWTVRVTPVAKIGNVEYETLEAAAEAAEANDTITLTRDVTLSAELTLPAGITLNGNGKQINGTIYAGGDLTVVGHTKVTAFSASYYNRTITIGEGACLEITGSGRVSLAYGNTFNITGSVEEAKTADKANIQPSLIIPAGISITGGNDATMNVTNAYVQIGSTTSKPGAAGGKFTFNFENSIAEFTKEFGFYEPTGGVTPEFVMNIKDSIFTTGAKLCIAAANSKIVVDNSVVTLGTYLRNSGAIELKNGSVMTGSTIQFGENGGNNGAITVDNSTFTIVAGSTGSAFDGKGIGSITAQNGATVAVDYYKDMTINVDTTSTFTGTEVN